MGERLSGIPFLLLWFVSGAVIFAIIIATIIYSEFISKIPSTELNLEVLDVLASIILPITFLIFIEVSKDRSWRKMRYNKIMSVAILICIFIALYFTFGAGSISIINSSQNIYVTIHLMYAAIAISLITLVALITIYVYIY